MILGIGVGYLCNRLAPDAGTAKEIAGYFSILTDVFLRLIKMVIPPVGVFGAMAAAITTQGIGVLATYGKFIGGFYFGLVVLWIVLIGVGCLFLSRSMITLLKLIREPMMIAFSTASSEAAYRHPVA